LIVLRSVSGLKQSLVKTLTFFSCRYDGIVFVFSKEEEKMEIERYTIDKVAIPDEKLYGINTKRVELNFPSSSNYKNKI